MVELVATRLRENAAAICLEGSLVGLDGNRNGLLRNGLHQSLCVVSWDIIEACDASFGNGNVAR